MSLTFLLPPMCSITLPAFLSLDLRVSSSCKGDTGDDPLQPSLEEGVLWGWRPIMPCPGASCATHYQSSPCTGPPWWLTRLGCCCLHWKAEKRKGILQCLNAVVTIPSMMLSPLSSPRHAQSKQLQSWLMGIMHIFDKKNNGLLFSASYVTLSSPAQKLLLKVCPCNLD